MSYVFEAEIANAGVARDIIPSYAPMCEAYFYLQEATEKEWNNFKYNLGIYELGVLESTGAEIIYEEGSEEAPKNKIAELFKSAWERIKGLFDAALKKISEVINGLKNKFSAKFKSALVKKLAMSAGKTEDGAQVQKVYYKFNDYTNINNVKVPNDTTEVVDAEQIKKDAGVVEREVTLNWLNNGGIDTLIKYATDFKFVKGQIGSNYTTVKKELDQDLKGAKASNFSTKNDIDQIKKKITVANKYASVVLSLYHERQRAAIGILTKLAVKFAVGKDESMEGKAKAAEKAAAKKEKEDAKAAKKAEKEAKKNGEAQKESAVMESYTSEIEKMFDWNF